ncbi:cobalt-precorrin-6A reductase [Granulicoccus phenolivorans]|uniref:cobalt-precorrin-6A reductase n=1 Tax=Granulicoccus phenolivorans TaxID=266854 RepID=UPI00041AC154|nr:cobalt-precorrin-6A reductase [Granulicoccus phenolivorans]
MPTGPAVLILGGTGEARALARALVDLGVPTLSSLAGRVSRPALPVGAVRSGGFGGVAGLAEFLRSSATPLVIDATHPFAATMSEHAVAASTQAGVPLLRLLRPGWETDPRAVSWTWVPDISGACPALAELGERPFLTTGRQGLAHYRAWADRWALVRLVEPPDEAWPNWTILQRRGPFDHAAERSLFTEYAVDVLVTKNSGGSLTAAKLDVAAELGVPVVVVDRPAEPAAERVATVEAAVSWVRARLG